jgi:hypothetical protein
MELLQEIKEDIRRERLEKLWQRFGGVLVAAAVMIVVIAAMIVGWNYFQNKKAEKEGGELFLAIENFNRAADEASKKSLELAAENNSNSAILAHFHLATLALEANEAETAEKHYQKIIKTPGVAKEFLDLALLYSAIYKLEKLDSNAEAISNSTAQLKHLANDELSPWRSLALEQLSVHYLLQKDKKNAEETLNTLSKLEGLAASQRERVELLVSTLHQDSAS